MLHVGNTGVGTLTRQPLLFFGFGTDSWRRIGFLSLERLVNLCFQRFAYFAAHVDAPMAYLGHHCLPLALSLPTSAQS